jgi:hypothetical protein
MKRRSMLSRRWRNTKVLRFLPGPGGTWRKASREESGWPEGYFEAIEGFGGTEIEEPPEVDVALDDIVLDAAAR